MYLFFIGRMFIGDKMKLDDFINKTVVLELKDNTIIKGILLDLDTRYDEEEDTELRLVMRINSEEYRYVDVNEVISIGELI